MFRTRDEINKEKIDELASFLDFCVHQIQEMKEHIKIPVYSTPVGVAAAFENINKLNRYMNSRVNEIQQMGEKND